MPISRKHLYGHGDDAQSFIDSTRGTLLHEVGHYAGWNDVLPCSGHIVVSRHNAGGGAFVLSDASQHRVVSNSASCAFPMAAGCVTELFFCNHTNTIRNASDIESYRKVVNANYQFDADDVIEHWKRCYFDRIARIANSIEQNYDRCVPFLENNDFLIGDHHVIPTWRLRPPHFRWPTTWVDEILWTFPFKARTKALTEYLTTKSSCKNIQVSL